MCGCVYVCECVWRVCVDWLSSGSSALQREKQQTGHSFTPDPVAAWLTSGCSQSNERITTLPSHCFAAPAWAVLSGQSQSVDPHKKIWQTLWRPAAEAYWSNFTSDSFCADWVVIMTNTPLSPELYVFFPFQCRFCFKADWPNRLLCLMSPTGPQETERFVFVHLAAVLPPSISSNTSVIDRIIGLLLLRPH